MQSSPSQPQSNSPNSFGMQLLLFAVAIGMAALLWKANAKQKRPNTTPKVSKRAPVPAAKKSPSKGKQASLSAQFQKRLQKANKPQLRVVIPTKRTPARTVVAKVKTSKQPKQKARKITYKPVDVFFPLPFALKEAKRDAHYKALFKKAAALKVALHESIYLKLIHRERRYEANKRFIRGGIMRIAATRYIRYRSMQNYRYLGLQQLQALEGLLSKYLASGGPVNMIPAPTSPHFPLANKMIPFAGHFPSLLRNIGVVKPTKTLTQTQLFWLRTLFLSRWIRHALGHRPLRMMMGDILYEDYNKAVVLFSKKPKRRLQALRALGGVAKNFPALRSLGWLFAQLGTPQFAVRSYQDALKKNPKDTLTRTLLDKLIKSPS